MYDKIITLHCGLQLPYSSKNKAQTILSEQHFDVSRCVCVYFSASSACLDHPFAEQATLAEIGLIENQL